MDKPAGRERTGDVAELRCPVQLRAKISAGGAVSQVDLDLGDAHARPQDVYRHPYFHSPAGRQRARKLECSPGDAALT
jgi:hypothetical protein